MASTTTTATQPLLTADTWWDVVPGRTSGVTPLYERCKRRLGWDDAYCTLVCAAYCEFIDCKRFWRDWNATLLSPSIPVDQMWHQHALDSQRYFDDCQLLVDHMIHHNPDGDVDVAARTLRIQRTNDSLAARNGVEILNSPAWNFETANATTAATDDVIDDNDDSAISEQSIADSPRCRPRVSEEPDSLERNVRIRPYSSKSDNDEAITLKFREYIEVYGRFDLKETYFKIKMTSSMNKIYQAYGQMRGIKANEFRFMLVGERVDPTQTPLTLELVDQDEIDVMLTQCGC